MSILTWILLAIILVNLIALLVLYNKYKAQQDEKNSQDELIRWYMGP